MWLAYKKHLNVLDAYALWKIINVLNFGMESAGARNNFKNIISLGKYNK